MNRKMTWYTDKGDDRRKERRKDERARKPKRNIYGGRTEQWNRIKGKGK